MTKKIFRSIKLNILFSYDPRNLSTLRKSSRHAAGYLAATLTTTMYIFVCLILINTLLKTPFVKHTQQRIIISTWLAMYINKHVNIMGFNGLTFM